MKQSVSAQMRQRFYLGFLDELDQNGRVDRALSVFCCDMQIVIGGTAYPAANGNRFARLDFRAFAHQGSG